MMPSFYHTLPVLNYYSHEDQSVNVKDVEWKYVELHVL